MDPRLIYKKKKIYTHKFASNSLVIYFKLSQLYSLILNVFITETRTRTLWKSEKIFVEKTAIGILPVLNEYFNCFFFLTD